jgi:hypothetical protein
MLNERLISVGPILIAPVWCLAQPGSAGRGHSRQTTTGTVGRGPSIQPCRRPLNASTLADNDEILAIQGLPRACGCLPTRQRTTRRDLTLRCWEPTWTRSPSPAVPPTWHSQQSRPVPSGQPRTTPPWPRPAQFPASPDNEPARTGFGSRRPARRCPRTRRDRGHHHRPRPCRWRPGRHARRVGRRTPGRPWCGAALAAAALLLVLSGLPNKQWPLRDPPTDRA